MYRGVNDHSHERLDADGSMNSTILAPITGRSSRGRRGIVSRGTWISIEACGVQN